jgi:aminoglycoside N3'-acetyltransferase
MVFHKKTQVVMVLALVLCTAFACGRSAKEPPARDVVEGLLQQEANVLKQEGEQVDPSLGVKITWDIQSVEVREQPSEESPTWTGTIRFLIKSEQPEYDGSKATQTFEKVFDYVWDVEGERWIIQ